jgi:hypothetical protein
MARPIPAITTLATAIGGIALIFALSSTGLGQQAGNAQFIGVTECARCHTSPTPLDKQAGFTDWCHLTEFDTWFKLDKHAKAFELLKGERGQQMGRLLGIADVTKDQQCLSCHSNWQKGQPKPNDVNIQQGVSCESCHGPGSEYERPHRANDMSWRLKTTAEKAALGMIEVREPRQRAQQCLSCHVGNTAQGKVLTHEMYAAGHPPLPGIEVESFANEMPPHWRYLNDKPQTMAKLDEVRKLLNQPPEDLHGVKSVIVSGVVSLRESINYVRTQAVGDGKATTWPDFAQFDCAMCHHELQTPSWRQTRLLLEKRGQPGRPMIPQWPNALVEIGIRRIAAGDASVAKSKSDQFQQKLKALHGVFLSSPFAVGQATKIEAASQDLIAWLDELTGQLEKARYSPVEARATLADLCDAATGNQLLDYDSARQVAWALRTVYWSLDATPRTLDPAAESANSRWTAWAKQRENDPVSQNLLQLTTQLRLDIPWTQARKILDQNEQDDAFKATSQYNPAAFRDSLKDLRSKLTGVPDPAELQRTAQSAPAAPIVVEN